MCNLGQEGTGWKGGGLPWAVQLKASTEPHRVFQKGLTTVSTEGTSSMKCPFSPPLSPPKKMTQLRIWTTLQAKLPSASPGKGIVTHSLWSRAVTSVALGLRASLGVCVPCIFRHQASFGDPNRMDHLGSQGKENKSGSCSFAVRFYVGPPACMCILAQRLAPTNGNC